MRYVLLFAFCLLFVFPARASFDPLSVYGPRVAFDIWRKGEKVGEHVTRFERDGDRLRVSSYMEMDISLLFIPVYGFEYRATEIWLQDQLEKLTVHVVDGAEQTQFQAYRKADGLKVETAEEGYHIEGLIFSTNHWHPQVTQARRVLNTLTGNINQVNVIARGVEQIKLAEGNMNARRFDYQGELTDTSVWYDKRGGWVKLRFKARDGSIIEYRCRTCKPESKDPS